VMAPMRQATAPAVIVDHGLRAPSAASSPGWNTAISGRAFRRGVHDQRLRGTAW
jgi:hypothetical protein